MQDPLAGPSCDSRTDRAQRLRSRRARLVRRVFGLVYAGATDLFFGPTARAFRHPACRRALQVADRGKADFQLEFFKVLEPAPKPRPPTRGSRTSGYQMMGSMRNFDRSSHACGKRGAGSVARSASPATGARACATPREIRRDLRARSAGRARAALTRPEVPATVRTITVSVPHLDRFRNCSSRCSTWKRSRDRRCIRGSTRRCGGSKVAKRRSALLRATGALVELVQYESPARGRGRTATASAIRAFMNIAFVFGSVAEFDRYFTRAIAAGCRANGAPLGRRGVQSSCTSTTPRASASSCSTRAGGPTA